MTPPDSYEFSRPVQMADLETEAATLELTASEAECAALAARFGLLKVHSLTANATVRAVSGGAAEAEFSLKAEVEQESVISLEAVRNAVAEHWFVRYLPPALVPQNAEDTSAVEVDPDTDDIEIIEGESIDIGETIAQQLFVALDPYPRGPDEKLEDYWQDDAEEEETHPFAILKTLKQNN